MVQALRCGIFWPGLQRGRVPGALFLRRLRRPSSGNFFRAVSISDIVVRRLGGRLIWAA
jgi:hypothetical protein